MDATFWLVLATFAIVLFSKARNASFIGNAGSNSRLERKIDLVLNHLGIDPNQGVDEKIVELMKTGQKIEAIKLYREKTGCGLKEAKDYVESL
ncbi:MAG TPA: ribosomal protein L7/L12 [Pirellulales bacterium]|nr:ribosomal protein L7/L12 [Pirellulales bacterium]